MTRTERYDDLFTPAPWMRWVLWAACAYNLIWGLISMGAPAVILAWHGITPPKDDPLIWLSIWKCLGMVIGLYGVGYGIAATDPYRHWPLVLVGLLGKLFGPIGFLGGAAMGELPWRFGIPLIFNDLIWWVPFVLILWAAARANQCTPIDAEQVDFDEAVATIKTRKGHTLAELSHERPTLVLFLRHAGCTFCKQTLGELARRRKEIEGRGIGIVLVHMSATDEPAERLFKSYGVDDLEWIHDPERRLYRAFDLPLGSFNQLLGPAVWWRGFQAAILQGHGFGMIDGNGLQLPGSFLLVDGRIKEAHRHETAADLPDFERLTCAWEPTAASSS